MSDKADVTWMKDNKALDDKLADRFIQTEKANNVYRLDIKNCSEADSGIYIAKASSGSETSTSSAQLYVHTRKNNSTKIMNFFSLNFFLNSIKVTVDQKNELAESNMPHFVVRLKDTEVLENTFLRFMVKVKGEPHPIVKL